MDLDEEAEHVRKVIAQLKVELSKYNDVRTTYDRLQHEVGLLEGSIEDISYGLYQPHYHFDASPSYRQEQERVVQKKEMCAERSSNKMPG